MIFAGVTNDLLGRRLRLRAGARIPGQEAG
jgi:hypothetical protein